MRWHFFALFFMALMSFSFHTWANVEDVEIKGAYKDEDGHYIVRFTYMAGFLDQDLTFYGNEIEGFYQLDTTGFAGSSENYKLSFLAPTQVNGTGSFFVGVSLENIFDEIDEYTLVCSDKKREFFPVNEEERNDLQEKVRMGEISLTFLPENIRRPEYLFKVKNSDLYIYVDASKFYYTYKTFRFFVGELGNMEEWLIDEVTRYSDGGTTYIELSMGATLYSPTIFSQDLPTWTDGMGTWELEELDRDHFPLEELGISGVPTPMEGLRTPCELL